MTFSDSHCHLAGQYGEKLPEIIEKARDKGVTIIVGMGMNLESSAETIKLAKSYPEILAAVGIHPWAVASPVTEVRNRFNNLCRLESVIAIGEIGLDYVRKPETKEIQKELLIFELSLAAETGLPVSIHCRGAHADMIDMLRKKTGRSVNGVIHGFNGDTGMLDDWLELGFYVSIGTSQLMEENVPTEVISKIPADRLLTETDSSMRGGYPEDVVQVAEKLAAIRNETVDKIGRDTTTNLKRVLKL